MDSTEPLDLQPPCNCGALGDHPAVLDCMYRSSLTAEFSGRRAACLEIIGVLRNSYSVTIQNEWQDPQSKEWVFHLDLYASELSRSLKDQPPTLTPEARIRAVMDDHLDLEVEKNIIGLLTGLEDGILSYVLGFLVANGTIEHVRPDVYRKNS